MNGRGLAYADPDVIRALQTSFVAVACDDWYLRRQKDKLGEYYRKMSDQGPRKGNGTRQGLYIFTADGTLLAFRNTFDPGAVKALVKQGLDQWQALPEASRKPRPFTESVGKLDPAFERVVPAGARVVRVHARELEREGTSYREADPRNGRPNLASLDHLWIKPDEWKELASTQQVPAALARRIARFHLVDNTRGEPDLWGKNDVKTFEMKLEAESTQKGVVTYKVRGSFRLERGSMGFEGTLGGAIAFDTNRQELVRFDLVAVGDHWGESTYCKGARTGKAPVGVAFVLADGKQEADKVPPQAARDLGTYFGND